MDEVGPFQNEGAVLDPMTCITETFSSRSPAPVPPQM